jgi:hypothetical protein
MKSSFAVSLLIIVLRTSAQDSIDSRLIRDAIYSRRDTPIVYYIDSSITFYHEFSQFAKHGSVEGFEDPDKGMVTDMKFSKAELKYIDKQMNLQRPTRWPDLMFPKSIRITADSLSQFLSYRTSAEFQKERNVKWYYLFSQPIFVRNNTIAIFRLAEMIHQSAGNDLIFVYLKSGNSWARRMTIWAGSW